jgi:putative ABC transport system permease protein
VVAGLASVRTGLDALRGNRLRSGLATLGMVIGVASLVAVLSLADGMERYGRDELERTTGLQTVQVSPRTTREVDGFVIPNEDYPVFTRRDAEAAAALQGVESVGLITSVNAIFTGGPFARRRGAMAMGALDSALEFDSFDLLHGRFFTALEERRGAAVVVLSHGLAAALANPYAPEAMIGGEVRAGRRPLRVIGVLEPPAMGKDNHFAYVPLRLLAEVSAGGAPPPAPSLVLRATTLEAVAPLRERAEDWAARRFRRWEERVEVSTSDVRLAQVQSGMRIFRIVMGAITGISLLVGGIGIMNVLLASVAERTREIGVRKAVGARHRDVLAQFLAESVAIAAMGSGAGVVLGLLGAFATTAAVRATLGQPVYAALSWPTLLFAVLCATSVGLVFGTYPALRAARLSPIDAIRHD